MMDKYLLPPYVQRFFTDRLISQLCAAPNTIASYRDTFRLLFKYTQDNAGITPTNLHVSHIDAQLVSKFLTFCEVERSNSVRSRNTRLAAIKSFFKYVSINEPQLLMHCQKVLAIPSKRFEKRIIDFLDHQEIEALLASPDLSTWFGRRDRTLLLLMVQTGLRVSEVISLKVSDIELGTGAHLRCCGKGRKNRATPLRSDTRNAIRLWLDETRAQADAPLFAGRLGKSLSRDAVERILRKHTVTASTSCASLINKRITPHVLRHTAAMQLLRGGVDLTVIALWLGHESTETTQMYIHADVKLKEQAMARTQSTQEIAGRYLPNDELLSFLEAL